MTMHEIFTIEHDEIRIIIVHLHHVTIVMMIIVLLEIVTVIVIVIAIGTEIEIGTVRGIEIEIDTIDTNDLVHGKEIEIDEHLEKIHDFLRRRPLHRDETKITETIEIIPIIEEDFIEEEEEEDHRIELLIPIIDKIQEIIQITITIHVEDIMMEVMDEEITTINRMTDGEEGQEEEEEVFNSNAMISEDEVEEISTTIEDLITRILVVEVDIDRITINNNHNNNNVQDITTIMRTILNNPQDLCPIIIITTISILNKIDRDLDLAPLYHSNNNNSHNHSKIRIHNVLNLSYKLLLLQIHCNPIRMRLH